MNLLFGHPPKVIWIRTGNLTTKAIMSLLLNHKEEISWFIDDAKLGCLEILKMR